MFIRALPVILEPSGTGLVLDFLIFFFLAFNTHSKLWCSFHKQEVEAQWTSVLVDGEVKLRISCKITHNIL